MANECKGRWHTTLSYEVKDGQVHNPPLKVDDEVIEIEDEDANGNFGGKHHKTGGNLTGRCDHQGGQHTVRFERPEGVGRFQYKDGTVANGRIEGGRFKVVGPQGALPGEGDSGTWESVREGPPGPPEDEEEDEYGQGSKSGEAKQAY
jgi:hypothetical protein